MLRVDLRHYHRHVRRPAVRAVVGYDRSLCLRICFLDRFDLVLAHIYCAEYKINRRCNVLYVVYIEHDQFLYCLRHRSIHFPAVSHCLLVCLACGARACSHCHYLKPRMVLKQRDKSLSHHPCCAKNTYFQFLIHFSFSFSVCICKSFLFLRYLFR